MPADAVLLFEDETVLRLFPVLRRAWALRGEQAKIGITGRNAKRVLFGTINPLTGHRIIQRAPNMRQEHFQAFLCLLKESIFPFSQTVRWYHLIPSSECSLAF